MKNKCALTGAVVTLLLSLFAVVPTSSYGLSFEPAATYSAGNGPRGVVLGDFNGDGKLDMAAANSGDNNVSVCLGLGDGTFGTSVTYATGDYPFSITAADFNKDGKLDLAITNAYSNNVSVLLGVGDGTFSAGVNYGVSSDPYSIAVGDFNRDGNADLVVACFNGGGVYVLLGNGDGTFGGAVRYATPGSPQGVAVADFNGDGSLDLIVAKSNNNDASVFLGNGDGTFGPAADYAIGGFQSAACTGDFNGDGKQDLAVTSGDSSGKISVLIAVGDGTFLARVDYTVSQRPEAAAAGDFNGDGKVDLVTANMISHTASILLGNGDGTFQAAVSQSLGSNIWASSLSLGDIDGNGVIDLVAGSDGGTDVSVLLNSTILDGSGSFDAAATYPAGTSPLSVVVGDFDRNGKQDLAVANGNSDNVSILLGNGDGTFQAAVHYGAGSYTRSITASDFNKDGEIDLAVTNQNSDNVSILLGIGDGTFQAAVNYGAGSTPAFIRAVDFDGDGNPDLAVANGNSSNVSILLGNGDGTFQAAVNYGTGGWAIAISAEDFDRDGSQDLAVANDGGQVAVFLGNGDGTFQAAVSYVAGNRPYGITAADFNGDGKGDLAVASYGSSDVSLLLGNGDGTFQVAVSYSGAAGPTAIVSGDFDRDGRSDTAVANSSGSSISVFSGKGDGTLNAAQDYTTEFGPQSIALGDFNGDGKPDLAATNGDSVFVLINTVPPDTTPSTFTFTDQTGVALSTTIESNQVTISGINSASAISVAGGEYEINSSGTWTCAPGTVTNGQTVKVRRNSSGSFSTTTDATLTVGGVSDTFSVTTLAADTTPSAFTFADQTGVALNATIESIQVAISSINTASAISVAGGEYEINGSGTWTSAPGTVTNGQTVKVRQNSSGSFSTTTDATLTVGGVSDTFSVTTLARPQYTVTASAPDGHGTIVCDSPVLHGDNSHCTITPDADYHIASLTDNGSGVAAGTTYTITGVAADHTVVATFARLLITPGQGTVGTRIEIRGSGLGVKKGKVSLRGAAKTYSLTVESWNEDGNGLIVAVVKKGLPANAYTVVVQPKEPQKAPAIVETGVFEIAGPVITGVTPETATEGETVTLSGTLFGTTRPKIYLEYTTAKGTKRKSCKVTSWPGTPEAGTGAGEIQFTIPKGVPAGARSLVVQNGVAEEETDITIE